MPEMQKLDALIDKKGRLQADLYRAEQAVQEDGEMPLGRTHPCSTDPEKRQILHDARVRLAAVEAEIKACLADDKP